MIDSDVRPVTKGILTLVESQTRKQVVVQPDRSLATLATVKISRGDSPLHLIRYRPIPNEEPDYRICFQCGYVLRKFADPKESDWGMAATHKGRELVRGLVLSNMGKQRKQLPEQIVAISNQLLDGLLVHLLSVPVGLRIGQWLFDYYPELRDLQVKTVHREMVLNLQNRQSRVRDLIPRKIYRTTQTINAAFAVFWADLLQESSFTDSYNEYLSDARNLLRFLDEIPDDGATDMNLIDTWAKYLSISDWYEWIKTNQEMQ